MCRKHFTRIETNRCYINFTTKDDESDIRILYDDMKVWEYLGGARNQEQINQGINARISPDSDFTCWTVRRKETNEFLGNMSLSLHHDGVYTEVSYEFLSSVWGLGYAFEAVSELIQYAFSVLGLRELVAETQSANKASCNLLQKLGFYEKQRLIRFGAEQIIWAIEQHGGNAITIDEDTP